MGWLLVSLAMLTLLPATAQQAAGGGLNIVIIEGDGAINNIKQRTARETIVQVEDENHKPVAGAIVAFTTPSQGPTGVFADGSHLFTATTDSAGRVTARGLRLNHTQGRMEIRVTASRDGKTGNTTITQMNELLGAAAAGAGAAAAATGAGATAGLSTTAKILIVLAIAGGAAAAGVVVANRGGGATATTPTATTTTIAIGAPGAVGPPR